MEAEAVILDVVAVLDKIVHRTKVEVVEAVPQVNDSIVRKANKVHQVSNKVPMLGPAVMPATKINSAVVHVVVAVAVVVVLDPTEDEVVVAVVITIIATLPKMLAKDKNKKVPIGNKAHRMSSRFFFFFAFLSTDQCL